MEIGGKDIRQEDYLNSIKKFDVLSCDKNRTTAKYRTIAQNAESILVYLIVENRATSRDKTVREKS